MPTVIRAIRGNITTLAISSHCGQCVSRIPGVLHTCRVTKGASTSPWSMATKNLVLDKSWVGSERADLDALPQLPDPSPERALCRVEQVTLRVTQHASASVAECAQHLASREP